MKREKILFIIFVTLILTGCVRTDLIVNDYDSIISEVINNRRDYTNEVGSGYRFLIPKGVRLIESNANNQIFIGFDTKIYVYVDITSYFYKNSFNYDEDLNNSFYYKRIKNGDKEGFLLINKEENFYYVKIYYNYVKVEFYANDYNLNNAIAMSLIIANSVDYNNSIIEKILDDNNNNNMSEVTYNIEKPADSSSDFTQYLNEYITEDEVKDENKKDLPIE